ncbi:MAG TPA: NAD/NADP octopine/nopaline dehydrogenase family protein [Gaiellaceae bacterium]|nr:NAD/NADP octopine/nopaline dehydrogenase family protein [Gaiellaceae bacterium]
MSVPGTDVDVTVVGAGPGGLSLAARCGLRGCGVRLLDVADDILAPIRQAGGIAVSGIEEGFAPVAAASTDPGEVVPPADLVLVCVPGDALGAAADALARVVRPGQVVIAVPGCTGGALQLAAVLDGTGVLVAETDSFPFGCASPGPGSVRITVAKSRLGTASLPATRTAEAVSLLAVPFPEAQPAGSVLETSLSNLNAILHVTPMLANVGRVEFPEESFDFYREGVTPAVARAMARQDEERVAVASALGVSVPSLSEWAAATYGVRGRDAYETVATLSRDAYGSSPAPGTLDHRYLTEDVPCGALPVSELGALVGVKVDATRNAVELASLVLGRDVRASGRTLDRLGLAGLDRDGVRAAVGLPS